MNPVPSPASFAVSGHDAPSPDPLDEARQRLDALDESPLHEHPGEFTAIDGLLRRALDAAGTTR